MQTAERAIGIILAVTLAGATLLAQPLPAYALTCGIGVVSGSTCVDVITIGTSLTVPSDWNSTSNTIEIIAGGAGGVSGQGSGGSANQGGGGGGGGAYSKITNLSLTSGNSVTYSIGAGGGSAVSGGDTYFNSTSCTGASVCAKGGSTGTTNTGGAGGAAASGVGTVKYSGGAGGNGVATKSTNGGGAGGAAGPNGNGNVGANQPTSTGGSGDAGFGGTGGAAGSGTGGNGTEWLSTSGSGGGGGGATANSTAGGAGGNYGAGGGGGRSTAGGGGAGTQGIIVITYTPSVVTPPTVTTVSAESFTPTTATLFGSITAIGGATPTTRGFAYGTDATLTTGISTTTESGSFGVGSFSAALSSLSVNTTYYYRAYATNTGGTGYGSILSFATGNATPTRKMRLFEGFILKLFSGKIILY